MTVPTPVTGSEAGGTAGTGGATVGAAVADDGKVIPRPGDEVGEPQAPRSRATASSGAASSGADGGLIPLGRVTSAGRSVAGRADRRSP